MSDKINELKKEYQDILHQISKPKNINDIKKLQELSRKKAQLERIILDNEKLKKIEKEIIKTKKLIRDEKEEELIKIAKEELTKLELEKENLKNFLNLATSPEAVAENKNVILEIRPGTGGDEAELFASDLLKMYLKYAQKKNWRSEILNQQRTSLGGIKEAALAISGNQVYKFLKFESGVHRVQRIPQTEKSGRIHTSTASVAVLPEADEAEIQINPSDLKIDTFRASGPGGQGVNTTDSAVRICHQPSGVVVSCQDERSQLKNKEKALKILRAKLLEIKKEEEIKKQTEQRRSQIGRAKRAEKIRTYNFPQDRISDHRGGFSVRHIENILNGNLDIIIEKLINKE